MKLRLTAALIAAVSLLALGDRPAFSLTFSPTVTGGDFQIAGNAGNDVIILTDPDPQTAAAAANVSLAWSEGAEGSRAVYFRTSDDNGRTWGNTFKISEDGVDSSAVSAVRVRDRLYFTYNYFDQAQGSSAVALVRSEDGGDSFSLPVAVSDKRGGSSPSIAVDPQSADVIVGFHTGAPEAAGDGVVLRSTDGGDTFSDLHDLLGVELTFINGIQMAVGPGGVYVVGAGPFDLILLNVDIEGDAVNTTSTVFNNYDVFSGERMRINVAPDGTAAAVFRAFDGTNFDVFTTSWSADGTAGQPINVSQSGGDAVGPPQVAAGEGFRIFTWAEGPLGGPLQVFARQAATAGELGPKVQVTNDTNFDHFGPVAAVNAPNGYFIWTAAPLSDPQNFAPSGAAAKNVEEIRDDRDLLDFSFSGSFGSHTPDDMRVRPTPAAPSGSQGIDEDREPYVYIAGRALSPDGDADVFFTLGFITGDADCDAAVTAVDGLQVLREVAGLGAGDCAPAGDTNCDGGRTATDALFILRHVAGLPVNTPEDCSPIDV